MSYMFARVINNNAIVGTDRKREEVTLLEGRIGVCCIKYRCYIVASSLIEKVFVVEKKADERYVEELIKLTPFPYIDVVSKVVVLAERLLNHNSKDQLFLMLLDHTLFSVRRSQAYEDIQNPLLQEIRQFYPKEYDAAQQVVGLISYELHVRLDENEAAFITLHLVSAMSLYGRSLNKKAAIIMSGLTDIIQNTPQIELDEQSMYYIRFVMHLKYFLGRVSNDQHEGSFLHEGQNMHELVKGKYQSEWERALYIREHLKQKYRMDTSGEKFGYPIVHIVPMLMKRK